MKRYPSIPSIDGAPAGLFDAGHLWILEKIDGLHLRFSMQASGLISFGDRNRVFADGEDIPHPLRPAVHHVRDRFARDRFRTAVDDVESFLFFGVATVHKSIEYDWKRMPAFLGFDIWSAEQETFLPPDRVHSIFDRLGLEPVPAIDRERNVRDVDPTSIEIPSSAWYSGPAFGIVVRNKRGQQAKRIHPKFGNRSSSPDAIDPLPEPQTFIEQFLSDKRYSAIVRELESQDRPITFDTIFDRTMDAIIRAHYNQLFRDPGASDIATFRDELAKRIQELVTG